MRSLHGATSGAEQPEVSVANPMPNILGGMSSSSEGGVEANLRRASPAPASALPPSAPKAVVGQPEAMLEEQALAAWPSSSPLPAVLRGKGGRPSGPSPDDRAEASTRGAQQAAHPRFFMSEFA